jgi:hypothetical protein
MTFKGVSEGLNHIARVASASTRPHANGRIDLIPPDALEPEEYYNTIRDQYIAMNARQKSIQVRLTEINLELRATLPFGKFKPLDDERQRLAQQYTELQSACVRLRAEVRTSGKDAWAVTFYGIAKRVLGSETFKKLEYEVEALLGRPITEVEAGEGEWSAQKRVSKQRGDRRNQMRRNLQKKMRFHSAMAEKKQRI